MSDGWWTNRTPRPTSRQAQQAEPPPAGATVPAPPPPPGAAPLPPDMLVRWESLGPDGAMMGLAGVHTLVGGRIRALRVSPNGRRIYAGAANGGVWYSGDAGATWMPVDADVRTPVATAVHAATALSIGALDVQFGAGDSPLADVVWVGTGENVHGNTTLVGELSIQLLGVGIRRGSWTTTLAGMVMSWSHEAPDLAGAGVTAMVVSGDGRVWAGTTRGLYRRVELAGVASSAWLPVPGTLSTLPISDLVVGIHTGGSTYRLWAATLDMRVFMGVNGEAFAAIALQGGFPPASVPQGTFGRARLAASATDPVVYALALTNRLWRIEGQPPVGLPVLGVDSNIFGGNSVYNMAIAVSPSTPNQVLLGGSGRDGYASLYRATATQAPGGGWQLGPLGVDGHQWVGQGVHPDVHALAWVPGALGDVTLPAEARKPHVFVGCDGGVYRSGSDGDPWTFADCNEMMSNLEVKSVANLDTKRATLAAASEGVVIAGTQDNGAMQMMSPSSWRNFFWGDAFDAAMDAEDHNNILLHYMYGDWRIFSVGGRIEAIVWYVPPPGASPTMVENYAWATAHEADRAGRSKPAVITRSDGDTQVAVGTTHIWYSKTWGRRLPAPGGGSLPGWLTLPSLRDPSVPIGLRPGNSVDNLGILGIVKQLEWIDEDNLLALTWVEFYIYSRSDAGSWNKSVYVGELDSISGGAVSLSSFSIQSSTTRKLYVSSVDTSNAAGPVWWYNGAGRWINAGLNVRSPATVVVVDPDHIERVYVGTAIGVFLGVMTTPLTGDPTWAWRNLSAGLPEAHVTSMALHRPSRRLRVGLAGRGVYELNADHGVDMPLPAFAPRITLASFPGDVGRRPIPATARLPTPLPGQQRPYTDSSYPLITCDASPDIRVRRAPGTPWPAARGDLAILGNGVASHQILSAWAAMRTLLGSSVSVTGWEYYHFLVRSIGEMFPDRPANSNIIRTDDWGVIQVGFPIEMRNNLHFRRGEGSITANEAVALVVDEHGPGDRASCRTTTWGSKVDVALHTRALEGQDTQIPSVALFYAPYDPDATTPTPLLPAGWVAHVTALQPTTAWLPELTGWRNATPGGGYRMLSAPVSPRGDAAVTFDVNLPPGRWLLMAVVVHPGDPIGSEHTSPLDAARAHHQVACRTVYVVDEPDIRDHAFHEWHARALPSPLHTGPTEDDRRLVPRLASRGPGQPERLARKEKLYLDVMEACVVAFQVSFSPHTPALAWRAWWRIESPSGGLVAEHPQFSFANSAALAGPAFIAAGGHAWRWDGRWSMNGPFVARGRYFSVLELRLGTEEPVVWRVPIEVVGWPYRVEIVGRPKDDAALRPLLGLPVDNAGERISRDALFTVHRGWGTPDPVQRVRPDSTVFIGHGTLEDTRVEAGQREGAVALPRNRSFKGWMVTSPTGVTSFGLEDPQTTAGHCALAPSQGPVPINPFSSASPRPRKEGVQLHAGVADRTHDGLAAGGWTVAPLLPGTPDPALTWSGRTTHAATFGADILGATNVLRLSNKQWSDAPQDAILEDAPGAPFLTPEGGSFHLQRTLQEAAYGGFLRREIVTSPAVPDEPSDQIRLRYFVWPYAADSLYHCYHHAVAFGHQATLEATSHIWTLRVWRPRTVIRGWNGNRRTLLADASRVFGSWSIRRVTAGESTHVVDLQGVAGSFTAGVPVGAMVHTWNQGASPPAGRYEAVLSYRLQLEPSSPSQHAWLPEPAASDVLSAEAPAARASLAQETLVTEGGVRYLRGESVLVLFTAP